MVIPLSASVRAYRSGNGHLITSYTVRPDTHHKFSTLSDVLQANGVPSSKCIPSKLATILSGLQFYLDQRFGREAHNEVSRKLTIWPSRLFSDFSASGSVVCIFLSMFSFCDEFSIDEIDFSDGGNDNKLHFHLILHIEKALKRGHYLPSYKIFLSPNIPEREIVKLRSIAQDHGAAFVSASEVATHVLYPDFSNTLEDQTDGQVLIRLLARESLGDRNICLVHWFYHPDSYDDWVSGDEVLGHLYHPRRRAPHHQWHLQARWLRDLDLFNEWMNELDYEMPLSFENFIGMSAYKYDSAPALPPPFPVTRLRLRISAKRTYSTLSGVRQTQSSSYSGLDSDGQDAECSKPKREDMRQLVTVTSSRESSAASLDDPEDDVPLVNQFETRENTGFSEGSKAFIDSVTIPSFANWFSLHTIHEIEKRSLPEFFSGFSPSKTPDIYKEMRNFMVLTWRQKSQQYLSGTFVRRSLSGDASSILRVHTFLEHWGLINYNYLTDHVPLSMSSCVPIPLPTNAGVKEDVATRRGVHLILDDGNKVKIEGNKMLKSETLNGMWLSDPSLPSSKMCSTSSTHTSRNQSENKAYLEYRCESCRMDCSSTRFRCASKTDMNLCASCYDSHRYSATIKHSEFIQISPVVCDEAVDETDMVAWTENETFLLLEALEMYSDNWDLVAEHVGSKGKMQCVIHFLRLPIEDGFICQTKKSWWSEHPFQNCEIPTPLEILRRHGVRETALATIATKSSASKKFSGQPIVCGDQINSIVPFIEMLSSLASKEMVGEIVSKMDLKSSEVDKNIFRTILGDNIRKTGKENCTNLTKKVLSNNMYHKLLSYVKKPSEIVNCEYGKSLVAASIKLLSEGSISDEMSRSLILCDSECDLNSYIKKKFSGSSISNDLVVERDKHLIQKRPVQQSLERDSCSAVAMAVLCSACVSANQLASVEDMELIRLKKVVAVMKMEIMQRRLDQLKTILRGERVVKRWLKRKREERQCYETIRKRRIEKDGGFLSGIRAEPIVTAGPLRNNVCAGPCQNGNITLRDSMLTTYTVEEDLTSKLCMSMPELPNFSHEEVIDNVETTMVTSVDDPNGLGNELTDDQGEDNLLLSTSAGFEVLVSEAVATAAEAAASEMAAERD